MKIDRAKDIAYAGMDPREVPAYPIAEAARYIHLPASTLRRWVATGRLTDVAHAKRPMLSFRNLVEVHELEALRQPQPDGCLGRIARDAAGAPVAVYPVIAGHGGDSRIVVIDPFRGFGQPTIAGTGICTAVVAGRRRAGESLRHLAEDYGCSVVEIRAAVRFEARTRSRD